MNEGKFSRAISNIDDDLVLGAMKDPAENKELNLKRRRQKMTNKSTGVFKKWIAVAAMFAIILTGGAFIGRYIGDMNAGATVAFDVNPSIELEVNGKEKVTAVRTLNSDAETVIGNMDLVGDDLEKAVNAIIGSMLTHGYLSTDQNSILVSIDAGSGRKSEQLKTSISRKIEEKLGESNIDASVITQSFEKGKETGGDLNGNKVSSAKAALVRKIIEYGLKDANGVPYTYEVLAGLKVNELKLILDSKGVRIDGITSSGAASAGMYIKPDEAIEIALDKAGLTMDEVREIKTEMDFDDDFGALVYEVEFVHDRREYEYEIDAKTRAILEEEIDVDDGDGRDDDDHVSLPENSITRDAAIEAALTRAGLTMADIFDLEAEADMYNGAPVYEVEFETAEKEYTYTVDALTGEILKDLIKQNR